MLRVVYKKVRRSFVVEPLGVVPLRPPLGARDAADQKLAGAGVTDIVRLLQIQRHAVPCRLIAEKRCSRTDGGAEGRAADRRVPQVDRSPAVGGDVVVKWDIDEHPG